MKVCILAAGKSSRNSYSKTLPKGFLPINNRPGITYLIDSIEDIDEIVIAVSPNGKIYKQFFPILYPNLKITFVEVENFEGPGSGPGASLLECSKFINDEFVLIPTDAYIDQEINNCWDSNWVGVSEVNSSRLYCLVQEENGYVTNIYDKDPDAPIESLKNGFNGIAFIKNYKEFFKSLNENKNVISGEIQVSNGLNGLLKSNNGPGLKVKRIDSWLDFGSNENYFNLLKNFKNQNLFKNNEFTYLYNDKVFKYDTDSIKIQNKVNRAKELYPLTPKVTDKTENFFSYNFIKGDLLSNVNNLNVFEKFLDYCEKQLFIQEKLNDETLETFYKSCEYFYKEKTYTRLNKFWEEKEIKDKKIEINGLNCKSILDTLIDIDWETLKIGLPYNFHGDLQPENIIYYSDKFHLIDWRDSFGNSLEIGDIYYDLAKLDHALLVAGKNIRAGNFSYDLKPNGVEINFLIDNSLNEYRNLLDKFINNNNYDIKKVKVLSSLIYLNIAPLYEDDYSKFLYFLGQYKLNQLLYY